jgi:hypothetical protein
MRTDRALLISGAVLDGFAGLSLVVAPRISVALLLGAVLDRTGMMTARLTAIALLALALACWGAAADGGGPARSATFKAITFYNLGDGVFLIAFAASGKATGLFVWAVGLLHLALAVGFIACMRASVRART